MNVGMCDQVKQDLKNAHLVLKSLKRDHEQALLALEKLHSLENADHLGNGLHYDTLKSFNAEKIPLLRQALSQIQDGLDESEVLFTFAKYVESLEAENMKLTMHNQRLCEETEWLRDELKHTQVKLAESEALLAQTLVQNQQLEFHIDLNELNGSKSRLSETSDKVPERMPDYFHGSKSPHRCYLSPIGHSGTTARMITSSIDTRTGISRRSKPATASNSITDSQVSDVNGLMTSSLANCDLSTFSCSLRYHPCLLDSTDFPKSSKPSASLPSLRTLHRIVLQYTNQGKHELASSLCLQAVNHLEQSGGHDQAEVAVMLNILALVYRDQGKYTDASELLLDVVAIRERLFGSDHSLVAASLNNLAVLYAKAGRFSDAEPLCRRALAIRKKLLGPNHLDVAKQLNNLALLCQSQGRFEEVEVCFRQALDIYLKHHKPSSPTILRAKNNLASALLKRGNLSDAETLLKAVLSPNVSSLQVGPMITNTTSVTEADSAVFSLTSMGSSYNGGHASAEYSNGQPSSSPCRIVPLWLVVEQAAREGRGQLSRLSKLDLPAWAMDAHIELSIVLSALRNLAIVYQRQGLLPQANLLRSWIQPITTNGTGPLSSSAASSAELSKSTIQRDCSLYSGVNSNECQRDGVGLPE